MRKALYVGSFDPPTLGHLWVINQGAKLFDELIVGVGINPKKTYTFSMVQRKDMVWDMTKHLTNVDVLELGLEFSAKFAQANGCNFLLQGIRDLADYEYQKSARYVNETIVPGIETVFMFPPKEMVEVSSSFVKGLVGFNDWENVIGKLVPPIVLEAFKLKR